MKTHTADFRRNLCEAETYAARAREGGADMLLFPEMFLSGFDYEKNLKFLKKPDFSIEGELARIARENKIWLCGSNPHFNPSDSERPFNRMTLFDADGRTAAFYDKVHLFGLFREDRHVGAGSKTTVVDTPFGRIGLAICYDLRFPELFRRLALDGAKLVLFCACFPYPRQEHFTTLVRARAMENQYWLAAANRVGDELLSSGPLRYFGASAVLDPWGEYSAKAPTDEESLIFADISLDEVDKSRRHIDVFADRRPEAY